METSLQVETLDKQVEAPKKDPLVEEAKNVLRRAMLNGDRKEATKIALAVYQGEKDNAQKIVGGVNITDSNVQLIVNTLKEL